MKKWHDWAIIFKIYHDLHLFVSIEFEKGKNP